MRSIEPGTQGQTHDSTTPWVPDRAPRVRNDESRGGSMNPAIDYVPLITLPVEWEWALMKTGQILAICILLLISLAFLLLFDRKV